MKEMKNQIISVTITIAAIGLSVLSIFATIKLSTIEIVDVSKKLKTIGIIVLTKLLLNDFSI
jgi:hypothetical protein